MIDHFHVLYDSTAYWYLFQLELFMDHAGCIGTFVVQISPTLNRRGVANHYFTRFSIPKYWNIPKTPLSPSCQELMRQCSISHSKWSLGIHKNPVSLSLSRVAALLSSV